MLGYTATSLETADLPILPANSRATDIFSRMRRLVKSRRSLSVLLPSISKFQFTLKVPFGTYLTSRFPTIERRLPFIRSSRTFTPFRFDIPRHSPSYLLIQLTLANKRILLTEVGIAAVSALVFYTPAFFFRKLIIWLENDPRRDVKKLAEYVSSVADGEQPINTKWAWVYCAGLFGTTVIMNSEYPFQRLFWFIEHTSYSPC
jgi:hypothetical protein